MLLLKYKFNKNIKNFKFIKFNINRDLNFFNKFLKKNKIDYIIDFLAQSMVAESWLYPDHWYQTNVVSKVKLYHLLSKKMKFKKSTLKVSGIKYKEVIAILNFFLYNLH